MRCGTQSNKAVARTLPNCKQRRNRTVALEVIESSPDPSLCSSGLAVSMSRSQSPFALHPSQSLIGLLRG